MSLAVVFAILGVEILLTSGSSNQELPRRYATYDPELPLPSLLLRQAFWGYLFLSFAAALVTTLLVWLFRQNSRARR